MKALEPDVFHDCMSDAEAVERFNPSGTIGQNADGAGRGNSRDRGVSAGKTRGLQLTTFIGGERSPLLSQLT